MLDVKKQDEYTNICKGKYIYICLEQNFGPASLFEKQISKTYAAFSIASKIVNKIIWEDVLMYF